MSRFASILYLPKLHVAQERTGAFLANLMSYRHKYPILVYSDASYHESIIRKLAPAQFFPAKDPETVKGEVAAAVPNYVYLQGASIARQQGVDYFLVLETDCRVKGDNWDERIFEEFFQGANEPVLGGTLFVWHPFNFGMDYAQEFLRMYDRVSPGWMKANYPVPPVFIYGGRGSCESHRVCAYPNGALSVAKTSFVWEAYGNRDIRLAAQEGSAWDAQLGYFLFELYGPAGFRHLSRIPSVLSTYGDLLTQESLRCYLLTSGQVQAIHQVKSDWLPK